MNYRKFIIAFAVICLGLIGLSPLAHAETFADRAVIDAGTDLSGEHTFGEHMEFKAGIDFRNGQTFPAGTFFSRVHIHTLELRLTHLPEMELYLVMVQL